MENETHEVPVATAAQMRAGWSGVYFDTFTGAPYVVPVDPADATVCEACE